MLALIPEHEATVPCNGEMPDLKAKKYPNSVIAVGGSVQFRFITADGVRRVGASLATFAAPFSINNVWLALGCARV